MRMTALTALLAISAFACGGGGSNGDDDVPMDGPGGTTDGPGQTDGPVNPGTSPIGTTCTPDQANPQGSCPAGFQCLNLTGATNPWCSKTCTPGAGDACAADYTGPGKAACILELEDGGGQFCSVICQDMTADPPNQLCAAGQCNGLCPGALACSGDLQVSINNGPPMVLGQVCE